MECKPAVYIKHVRATRESWTFSVQVFDAETGMGVLYIGRVGAPSFLPRKARLLPHLPHHSSPTPFPSHHPPSYHSSLLRLPSYITLATLLHYRASASHFSHHTNTEQRRFITELPPFVSHTTLLHHQASPVVSDGLLLLCLPVPENAHSSIQETAKGQSVVSSS